MSDDLSVIIAAIAELRETRSGRPLSDVKEPGASIETVRADFLAELGKTRLDLMARMQNIRVDVTVNLAAAQLAEEAARSSFDQGRTLTDILTAWIRQVRQLQDEVAALRDGGTRPA